MSSVSTAVFCLQKLHDDLETANAGLSLAPVADPRLHHSRDSRISKQQGSHLFKPAGQRQSKQLHLTAQSQIRLADSSAQSQDSHHRSAIEGNLHELSAWEAVKADHWQWWKAIQAALVQDWRLFQAELAEGWRASQAGLISGLRALQAGLLQSCRAVTAGLLSCWRASNPGILKTRSLGKAGLFCCWKACKIIMGWFWQFCTCKLAKRMRGASAVQVSDKAPHCLKQTKHHLLQVFSACWAMTLFSLMAVF